MVSFFINRAGKHPSASCRRVLEGAKHIFQSAAREEHPHDPQAQIR
jgi:hypothetical protein